MRNFRRPLILTVLLGLVFAPFAAAQNGTSGRRTVRQSERVARASWQPTRPSAKAPVRTVAQVDNEESDSLPQPVPDPQTSIVEPPIQAEALDGQITLDPVYDGTLACDALPEADCGCGSVACTGCDSMESCGGGSCKNCGGGGCSTCGELCSPDAWRPCITLCLPQDGWINIEYLNWHADGTRLPALVSTSLDPNVPQDEAGVLSSPTTRVLLGGKVLDKSYDGARLRFGVWLNKCHTWGVGAELFDFSSETQGVSASSTGNPILARPFFNTQTGLEDSGLVAYPGVATGSISAFAETELSGASIQFRHLRCCEEGMRRFLFCNCPEEYCTRTEVTFGYRFLQLDDGVVLVENMDSADPANPGSLRLVDSFRTRNQFNGLDVGWSYRRTRGFWTFDSAVRLAFGNTKQSIDIRGASSILDPASPPAVGHAGGFLAQTSNIGIYENDAFAVVPEFNFNFGYQMTDHLRASLGYTFIYWSNVARAGEQISTDINPGLFPPPQAGQTDTQRPAFKLDTTDYWVQGVNLGLEYRW